MLLWKILHLPVSNLTQVPLSCHHLPRLCTCVLKHFARFFLEESRIDYLLLFIDMLLDFSSSLSVVKQREYYKHSLLH